MTPAYIVHLDDSPYLLAEARKLLSSIECQLTSVTNVADASRYLQDFLSNSGNRQNERDPCRTSFNAQKIFCTIYNYLNYRRAKNFLSKTPSFDAGYARVSGI